MFGTFRAFRRCGVVSITVSCNCFLKDLKMLVGLVVAKPWKKIKIAIEKMVFLQ